MAKSPRAVLPLTVLVLSHLSTLSAQNHAATPSRRWGISGTIGGSIGDTGPSLEGAMVGSGFGDTVPCIPFIPCPLALLTNPYSVWGGSTKGLAVSYRLGQTWRLRAEWMPADLGETHGYHNPSALLYLHTSVTSLAVSSVASIGVLRIGAGPSVNLINVTRTDAPGGPPSQVMRLGLTLQGGLVFPTFKGLFVEALVHRALVGSAAVGPFTAHEPDGTPVTMPRTRTSFSYTAIRVGLGLRI